MYRIRNRVCNWVDAIIAALLVWGLVAVVIACALWVASEPEWLRWFIRLSVLVVLLVVFL